MSIPVSCPKCGVLIGEIEISSKFDLMAIEVLIRLYREAVFDCSHTEPKRTKAKKLLGLVNQIHVEYPETGTTSSWLEYSGPLNKFMLWVTLCFVGRRRCVLVNNKWVGWNPSIGFFGDGVKELEKLKAK